MCEPIEKQDASGKQKLESVKELSEWDKNLLSDMDRGTEWLDYFLKKQKKGGSRDAPNTR